MNKVFVQGKIISEINFNFIINSKNLSIVIFNIELFNKSIIRIKVYNKLADYCYRELNIGKIILVEGYLNSKIEVIAKDIKKLE